MAFVRVSELLQMGKENNACVLAFDAADLNMIKGVIYGAEKAQKPVMVMLYPGMKNVTPFGVFAETVKYYANKVSVPVGLHLDHCSDFDEICQAIHEGFTSVMADGSVLPFEENVAFVNKVMSVAKNFGVDVEAELGHVGNAADSDDFSRREFFTKPEEVKAFIDATGVTSLAVAFGSAHGLYKGTPHLDIEHLRSLDAATDTPLVLHGGTGIPDDQLAEAFANGINKINIGTEFFNLTQDLKKKFYSEENGHMFNEPEYIQPVLIDYIAKRLELSKIKL